LATPIQESQWVLRAQCQDREALELLLRSVEPVLRRYIAGLVGGDEADDILQDVLLIVARKLYWLERPDLFRAWAFRIASRAAFRHLKKRKRWTDAMVDQSALDDLAAPDIVTPDDARARAILELLESPALSPASRAVLALHFQEEMPLAHVAAVLEIPLGTVKSAGQGWQREDAVWRGRRTDGVHRSLLGARVVSRDAHDEDRAQRHRAHA
jgi:RNA polymerase sigma-70 factor (ECF subfamily)